LTARRNVYAQHSLLVSYHLTIRHPLKFQQSRQREVNQEPGVGPDQEPRQKQANTGATEHGVVRNTKDVEFGRGHSNVFRVMRVTMEPAPLPGAN
jgi:hypothetical protein